MHTDPVEVVVAVIGLIITWTGSVIGLVMWLTSKFRRLEIAIYRESNKQRSVTDVLKRRVQRLEIKSFGFTGPAAEPTLEED